MRRVLVTGATGNQGGATVRRLLEAGKVSVRGLTRDPASPKAKALAEKGVELAAGDFDDRGSLDRAMTGVQGVFVVSTMMGTNVEIETRQGVAAVEAAAAAGVEHVVYTSVDGAERHSGVPHFDSKWKVEERLRALGVPWTVLRPTLFMDMLLAPGTGTNMFLGLLHAELGDTKPVQMVATTDIGWFAARALEDPGTWAGHARALAGDELTVPAIAETIHKVRGKGPWVLPIPKVAVRVLPEDLRLMLIWFAEHGYEADIPALRRDHPALLSLEGALRGASS